jgi:hypothetical protein
MRQFGISRSDRVTVDGGSVGGYDNSGGDSFVSGPNLGRSTSYCAAENRRHFHHACAVHDFKYECSEGASGLLAVLRNG